MKQLEGPVRCWADRWRPAPPMLFILFNVWQQTWSWFHKERKNRIPNYLTLCRYYRNLIVFASETLRPRIINLRIARCNFLFSRRNTNGERRMTNALLFRPTGVNGRFVWLQQVKSCLFRCRLLMGEIVRMCQEISKRQLLVISVRRAILS